MANSSDPVREYERERSRQNGAQGSSILQGVSLASQSQHPRNHVSVHQQSNSNSQGRPSLSGAVLSSLGGTTFIPQVDRGKDESKKKSKKHKHERDKDKDKSKHSSSRKKRRNSNSIAHSSKIALASAENFVRRNQDQHGVGSSSQSNDVSSSMTNQSVDQSSTQFFNGAGQAFSMPSQFSLKSQPIQFSASGGATSVVGNNSLTLPLSGISAPHQVLFTANPRFSGHYASTVNFQPSAVQYQLNSFPLTYPHPQLTEQQFKLHNEANGSNADGVLQMCHVSDNVAIDHNIVSVGDGSVAPVSRETTASRICDQNTVTNVSVEDLRSLFHLTLVEASKRLGMCTTLFKKICRKKNIEKWPYRKIHSLMNKVDSLQHYLADSNANISDSVKLSYNEQIEKILEKVNDIKRNTGSSVQSVAVSEEESGSSNPDIPSGSFTSSDDLEKRQNTQQSCNDNISVSSSESFDSAAKRRRCKTSYDFKTGWVANCSTCGKLGKYRHPTQGRVFQHSSGTGKYCGYFRDNPRREESPLNVPEYTGKVALDISATVNGVVLTVGKDDAVKLPNSDSTSVENGTNENSEVSRV